MTEQNNFGQYIGSHLDDDVTLSLPDLRQLPGRYCTLQLLSTRHGNDLFQGWHSIEDSRDWTYLPDERPPTKQATHSYIQQLIQQGNDSNLLIVFYVQIMPDDFVMQLHRF